MPARKVSALAAGKLDLELQMYLPFFRFGQSSSSPTSVLPLGLITGGLIMDSGEAERTFIFRCQDRYLTLNNLVGLRSILFVADEAHRRLYESLIRALSNRLRVIREFTEQAPADIQQPLYVPCDIDLMMIEEQEWFLESLSRSDIAASLAKGIVYLNQISPSCAELLIQLGSLVGQHGFELSIDALRLRELGDLALAFHNKARYVELVRANSEELPLHVMTAILSPHEFLNLQLWEDLVNRYVLLTGDVVPASLYVKSSLDSGGNVAARLCKDNFATEAKRLKGEIKQFVLCQGLDRQDSVESLRQEVDLAPSLRFLDFSDARLAEYRKLQRAHRIGIEILAQREVVAPKISKDMFDSIGITYDIRGRYDYILITAAPQFYADANRHHYIGSYVSETITKILMTPQFCKKVEKLCGLFAGLGYRGPINFDARRGAEGEYVFLFDCNPRLSAIYPSLAVQAHLRQQGLRADSVLSLGYRGEFVYRDLRQTLSHIMNSGFLYTVKQQKGVVLLPNLSRDNGVDAVLVNMERSEMEDLIGSGLLQTTAEAGVPVRPSIF
jgi:hypothetical protein